MAVKARARAESNIFGLCTILCKKSGYTICFLYVEQIIEGYIFITIGLQETFIEGWGGLSGAN